MSIEPTWTVRGLNRYDTLYSGPEADVIFNLDLARRRPPSTSNVPQPVVYVMSIDSARYAENEKPVPAALADLVADRVSEYSRAKGWEFYTQNAKGWCDDRLGKRWPSFSSVFPVARHALGWTLTDNRWGRNSDDPWVVYEDERASIRFHSEVGYSAVVGEFDKRVITCVFAVPESLEEMLVERRLEVDRTWFERVKQRIADAYDYDSKRVTFVAK